MYRTSTLLSSLLILAVAALPATAIDVAYFEERVTTQRLDNGLTLLIYERPTAPVVSFFTHVDVGAAQEVPGITGLAHMFEHMAFKGTRKIGTEDYEAERRAMEREDAAYAAYAAARSNPQGVDEAEVARLRAEFEKARDAAKEHVQRDEFSEIVDRAGGVGLNAFTSADETGYTVSMPANKLELWAFLESARFLDPVFREFYQERDVVQEERRMRTESRPIGRLIEQFVATAFQAHPYGHPVVGHMSDLQAFTRQDAQAFYAKHYVPANMVVAVVGDVKAKQVLPLLERYLSRLPAGDAPPPLRTVEPPQIAEKTIRLEDPSQPVYVEAYHRPSALHPDDAIYDAISNVLSSGRTSRLYRRLVRDEKIAVAASSFSGFPGSKYPHLMLFFAMPTAGHTNEEVQQAIRSEIDKLRTEPVGDEELRKVKTDAQAGLVRSLQSNEGIAGALASYQALFGDWRELIRSVERIEKVTSADILRVAEATFVPKNRTVGMIVNAGSAGAQEDAR